MSRTSDRLRIEFKKGDDIRDAGLTTPADVVRYDDIPYGELPKWQTLDVYRPAGAEGKTLPVIVSVHGGGWVYGDKELYQYYCMSLAQRGFAVVNFSYRLAPEHKYPAPMEDANAVFHWVLAHADAYGMDARNVFAVGDSAGAHLLSLYACLCTNPEYAVGCGIAPPEGFAPKGVGLACGVYDIDISEGSRDRDLMDDLLPGGASEAGVRGIIPLLYITPAFPPAFVFTATGDYLRDQAPKLIKALQQNDVPFVYRLYGDSVTRPSHVFHVDMRNAIGQKCNDDQCAFFRSLMD